VTPMKHYIEVVRWHVLQFVHSFIGVF